MEEHHGQRKLVRINVRKHFLAQNLRCHEVLLAQNLRGIAIDNHIVIVTNGDVARVRIEKDVEQVDVTIAKTLDMKLQKAIGQLQTCGSQYLKRRIDTPSK